MTNYRSQSNELRQAVALSNLALAYQKLGKLNEAQQAITDSLKLLEKSSIAQNIQVMAPILDIQGSIQLDLGQAEQALKTWQRAEQTYKQLGDQSGITRDRINQSQAWQVLGFYRRGLTILTELQQELQTTPNSVIKAVELRSLGDALQLAGDLHKSRQVLQQSLEIAQKLDSSEDVSATLLSLGNTARVQQDFKSEFNSISQAILSTTQLLDQDFNSKNLESKVNAVPFNVLHLATHGQFSSRAENTFILAADGPINVTRFDSLLRHRDKTRSEALEMLVLSACQTAVGDNRATLGLAGASVKAGARSTLASLWHISDKSTAILIGEFYRELVGNWL